MPLQGRCSSFAPEIIISSFPDSHIWSKAIVELVQTAQDSFYSHRYRILIIYKNKQANETANRNYHEPYLRKAWQVF